MKNLIQFSSKGIYCPSGDFYIDPWYPVKVAIITHAHSDHLCVGSKLYFTHHLTKPFLEARIGIQNIRTASWGESFFINGVKVSLYPAGHIIGSSQIKIEKNGEVWVVSGDYKIENDGISGKFEPVKCHYFITESTFGLPIFKWVNQDKIYSDIISWVNENKAKNKTSILLGYSLGKAQRILNALAPLNERVFVHGAVYNMQQAIMPSESKFALIEKITNETSKKLLDKAIVVAPPSVAGSLWLKKFKSFSLSLCSGWMQVRGNVKRKNMDEGFVLSDHADWQGLLMASKATQAQKVYVTHGYTSAFSRFLNESGIEAEEVITRGGNEEVT